MRELLFKLLGALILIASFVIGWLWMDYQNHVRAPLPVTAPGVTLEIPTGASVRSIGRELTAHHLLSHPGYFVWLARIEGVTQKIQTGEYRITPGMNLETLLQHMVKGDVVQHSLTLVDGWTFRQVMAAVESDPELKHTLTGLGSATVMARIGHPGKHAEGRFFPDTYHFPRGTTDVAFLKRAYGAMAQKLARAWAGRAADLPLKTPYQALILASIVEKETAKPEELQRVAGVFIRRLQRGMRLQTDPAVIYGLGPNFNGDLTRADLKRDTPYNTYLHGGLPPTPIAMPGAAALHAALHPAPGRALYFVARGDGTHQFSDTFAEQQRAVLKYQIRPYEKAAAKR